MAAERDGIKERRGAAGGMHECYAYIQDAVEKAVASTNEHKQSLKYMWGACKDMNATEFDAYTKNMHQIAMLGALSWLTVAAEADRALRRGKFTGSGPGYIGVTDPETGEVLEGG
jgi:hypothetical protein